MSTKRNTNYQQILLQQSRRLFRTNDLQLLWGVQNRHNLRVTIKRYLDRGILHAVQRGLYASVPLSQLDPFELACAVAGPYAYVSAETVMARAGLIMQLTEAVTVFGVKAKELEVAGQRVICRYLHPRFLLDRRHIQEGERYALASPARAVADAWHLRLDYYIDNQLSPTIKEAEALYQEIYARP